MNFSNRVELLYEKSFLPPFIFMSSLPHLGIIQNTTES